MKRSGVLSSILLDDTIGSLRRPTPARKTGTNDRRLDDLDVGRQLQASETPHDGRRPKKGQTMRDSHRLRQTRQIRSFETLESRRVLDCHGIAPVAVCVPGDSSGDLQFNESDLVDVFQAGKYRSGTPATWREGDWNRDGEFNSRDLVTVFQAGTYLQGVLVDDLTSLVESAPPQRMSFGPPITITDPVSKLVFY